MRKIFFFLLPLIFSFQSPPKVFAVVQKWPVKLHSNSSVSLEGGESNNILFDSDVTTIYNKLTVYADADFDFSTEFELAAKSLEELEVDVFEHEISQPSPPPPSPPPLPPPSPLPPPPPPSPLLHDEWHGWLGDAKAEASAAAIMRGGSRSSIMSTCDASSDALKVGAARWATALGDPRLARPRGLPAARRRGPGGEGVS